ncbi:MAG: SMC-Scp complex subunit ScpB [Deltaproteobacteria bacterium]|nr:SMC-Scp complex subunit ScpB [Deltaproteobacteria bacterium]
MTDQLDEKEPAAEEPPAEDVTAAENEVRETGDVPPPAGTFARGDLPAGSDEEPTAPQVVPDEEPTAPQIVPPEEPATPEAASPEDGVRAERPDQEPTTNDQERAPERGPTPARVEYDDETLARHVEALLFVALRPLSLAQLARPLRTTFAAVRRALKSIGTAREASGVRLVEVGGGWQLRTAPECADVVGKFLDVKPLRLSKAAMETLAVIAYRQPVTKPDVDDIRGVDSGSAVKLLLDRTLVRVLGRKEEPGRPLLYGTTPSFLEFFGLGNLGDLPSLREYAELSEDGRRQLERDLFARSPEPIAADDGARAPAARHWQDLVEVLGDDLGGLPDGVEVEPSATGDPLEDYLLDAGRSAGSGGAAATPAAEPAGDRDLDPGTDDMEDRSANDDACPEPGGGEHGGEEEDGG